MGMIVVSGLVAKRAELAGQIQAAQQNIVAWHGALKHVDATIKLFSPETDLRAIRPRRHRKRNALFAHGELNRAVLEVLRDADKPLGSRALARHLIDVRGIPENPSTVALIHKGITVVLQRLCKSGLAHVVGHDGRQPLWARVS